MTDKSKGPKNRPPVGHTHWSYKDTNGSKYGHGWKEPVGNPLPSIGMKRVAVPKVTGPVEKQQRKELKKRMPKPPTRK